MPRDFEEREVRKPGGKFTYDPDMNRAPDPLEGKKGENLVNYYGPVLSDLVLNEIRTWAEVLMAIKDGIPKPYDSSVIIDKILRLEHSTGEDFTELKNCCPPSGEVREALQMKPFIFGILDRIVEIGEIGNYVEKHSNTRDRY